MFWIAAYLAIGMFIVLSEEGTSLSNGEGRATSGTADFLLCTVVWPVLVLFGIRKLVEYAVRNRRPRP